MKKIINKIFNWYIANDIPALTKLRFWVSTGRITVSLLCLIGIIRVLVWVF